MSLRHVLLGLLVESPRSGWDLTAALDEQLVGVWSAKHSQVYPELVALAGDGLVEVAEEGARRRKTYAITPAGEAELDRWLRAAPRDRPTRDDAAARLRFLGRLPRSTRRAVLEEEVEFHRARLTSLPSGPEATVVAAVLRAQHEAALTVLQGLLAALAPARAKR